MSQSVEVMIVERHPVLRRGLEACLERVDGMDRVECVGSVADAWASPALGEVDLLLLGIATDGALPFISEVRDFTDASVVVYGPGRESDQLLGALETGATAAMDSDALTPESLVLAVRAAAAGGPFLLPSFSGGGRGPSEPHLTQREQEVLALVAEGYPTREVALEMNYSERTVKKVLGDVVVKLGARSRSQAIARAVRQGII